MIAFTAPKYRTALGARDSDEDQFVHLVINHRFLIGFNLTTAH